MVFDLKPEVHEHEKTLHETAPMRPRNRGPRSRVAAPARPLGQPFGSIWHHVDRDTHWAFPC